MKNSFLKKSACAVMTAALLFTSTGCGAFLAKIASKGAIDYLTEALDAFYADPVSGLSDYDDSFEIPELLDESLQFALDGISATSYEIGEASLNKGRTTAKIPVTFSKVIEVEDISMGTVDEIADALGDCDTQDVEITFTLKNEDGDWTIEDMSELVEVFFDPYTSLVFIDENGMPTSFNQDFFDECTIDSAWYDPYMATPLNTTSMHGAPEAMLAVVYFDRPMYITFTANLIRGGETVQSIEVVTNGDTIAYCEFWGETYIAGSYTMELVYADGTVAETTSLTIN